MARSAGTRLLQSRCVRGEGERSGRGADGSSCALTETCSRTAHYLLTTRQTSLSPETHTQQLLRSRLISMRLCLCVHLHPASVWCLFSARP